MEDRRLLYLNIPNSNEALQIYFLLSSNLNLPLDMTICIMMGDIMRTIWTSEEFEDEIVSKSEWNRRLDVREVMDRFGVCLGIRKATKDYIQFFYICPVRCISDYSGEVKQGTILANVDDNPCLKHGMECVIEHCE